MTDSKEKTPFALLFSRAMVLLVWLPIVVIGVLHYILPPEQHWTHYVLRRLYYLPIIFAAFLNGLRGGLAAAFIVSLTYFPHAFLLHHQHDPAHGLEKVLEMLLYHVVGAVAGYLADLERKRRLQLKQALDEQQRLTGQLVRAGRLGALGEVVAGIAHEVKNPLHSMLATAEIIDPLIDENSEERRMWEIHIKEIKRLQTAAERFLSFARPDPLELTALDLREVARRLMELVEAEARQRGVNLSAKLPDDPVMIQGDRDQLAQIALNVALNGFRAMGEKGGRMLIYVETARVQAKEMGLLRIENDGPAIPEDRLEQIFDPFHTTDETGSGLGLSISARIAEQHGGYIEAANRGIGVAFTLCLPLRRGK